MRDGRMEGGTMNDALTEGWMDGCREGWREGGMVNDGFLEGWMVDA